MKYELILRRIRSHPALWGEMGPRKEAQAERIRDKCKARLAHVFKARAEHAAWLRSERALRAGA